MPAPLSVQSSPYTRDAARRRRLRSTYGSSEIRPRGRGRLFLAYMIFLWLMEPEGVGLLLTDMAETVVSGVTGVVVAANDEVLGVTDRVLALDMILDRLGR